MSTLRYGLIILLSLSSILARAEPPPGFVYLSDVEPTIIQDIRYSASHNFVGRMIAGYQAPQCVLTRQAAAALGRVQKTLLKDNLSLIVWDCYRPTRAVADFWRWSQNQADFRMKDEFYPNIEKASLFASGYLAKHSAHSRGSTVDVGLAPSNTPILPFNSATQLVPCTGAKGERFDDGTIDLGTGYDCLDPKASVTSPLPGQAVRDNRLRLRQVMVASEFKPYNKEWWHFELANEPYPRQEFDFVIEPKRP